MNYEELFENDDSAGCLIISDDNSIENKSRKTKKSKEQPFDQEKFIILPLVKTQSLTQEELSSLSSKYVEQSSFFDPLKNIVVPEQSEAADFSVKCDKKTIIEMANQDPLIDSTNFNNREVKNNLEFHLPDEEKIPSIQQLKFFEDGNLNFQEDLEDTRQNYHLDSEFIDHSLGGCRFVIKDCFLGEKNRNISELDGFQLNNNSKLSENCMEAQFEQPILERLFSQVSDVSQSSTITVNPESDELEYSYTEEKNTETPEKRTLLDEKLNIVEDGIIPVISKSDSNVYIIGSS